MNLHFIHGFLGSPSDWNKLKIDQYASFYHDFYYEIEAFLPQEKEEKNYFTHWAQSFNNHIFSSEKFINKKNILIGYSLGGRLALHCLLDNTSKWDTAIIISANPGLENEEEKLLRIKNDEKWAHRFLHEEWNFVINAWNSQGVFSGQENNLNREENNFNREKISKFLLEFSLGKQKNLREKIKEIQIPLLWLAGEFDTKFSLIAKEMSELNNKIQSIIVPKAGHRVPFENSEDFKNICLKFITEL